MSKSIFFCLFGLVLQPTMQHNLGYMAPMNLAKLGCYKLQGSKQPRLLELRDA
jgi:hypothetical protein